jgi:hypothetical protein
MQLSQVVRAGVEDFIQRLGHCLTLLPYALIGASCFTDVRGGWRESVFNMHLIKKVTRTLLMRKYQICHLQHVTFLVLLSW